MSTNDKPAVGEIVWTDLTVPDAAAVKDFYQQVVGWQSAPVNMGDYDDFNMNLPESGETVAGICHARGQNANLPPRWLIYIRVEDVDRSAQLTVELGGNIISEPKDMESYGRFCVIQDPAGAVAALFTPAEESAENQG